MGNNKTHCFLSIRPSIQYGVDHVTGLHLYKIGNQTQLIGLPALRKKKQWIVPVTTDGTMFSIERAENGIHAPGQTVLHVDWDSSFLL